jgi:lipopolysaccharide export system protein LptA
MRRVFRPLILIAILAVVTGVGATYYARLKQLAGTAVAKPKALPPGTTATSHQYTFTHTTNEKTVITMHADDLQEVDGKQQLSGVVLDIASKEANKYHRVKSAKAEFDMAQGILYSDGEVEITMGVGPDAPPSGRLMVIKSSGMRVESKTGKASTDRLTTFKFDRGEGKAVGADYDPSTRELGLHSQVELIWRGANGSSAPMKVETSEAHYKERDAKVLLSPWCKLTRDTLNMNAGPAIITLSDGDIKLVETQEAHGTDQRPGRNLEYSAKFLNMDFNDASQIQKITAVEQARLVSTADTAITTLTSDRVVMDFDTSGSDSILQNTFAEGHSVMESKPVPKPGVDAADTRILKSETIQTKMRPGGQEIESMVTHSPGAIEFVPNQTGQPHRWMNGERIAIAYAEKNQIQTFRSTAVTTRTQKPRAKDAKEDPAIEITTSKDLLASFQPNTSQLAKLEQWGDFRYQAGDRKAKADRAVLDQPKNLIDLTGTARVWDPTGSADAEKITLDQKSGDFTADGNVSSTRMPDKKDNKKTKDSKDSNSSGGLLAEDEPLHARAKKMRSTDNNLQIRYEGNAVLWQSANRLEADVVEIDRDNSNLKAHGHVISQLLDKGGDDASKNPDAKKPATKATARVFTIVRAPELEYDDNARVALYKDGATLDRPDMKVKAKEIRAFLRDDSSDSSLDHAFADGKVEIVQTAPGRVRNGTSEHAEYFVDEGKIILTEGRPKFVDSLRGTTQGEILTWFSKDDRLLVNGVESQPVKSVLHRKSKK